MNKLTIELCYVFSTQADFSTAKTEIKLKSSVNSFTFGIKFIRISLHCAADYTSLRTRAVSPLPQLYGMTPECSSESIIKVLLIGSGLSNVQSMCKAIRCLLFDPEL